MNNDIKNLREILLSDDGISNFIISLIKNMMEKLLQQELTEFLKYDKCSYEGRNSGNSRNGYYTRNYETRYGVIEDLHIPRDRKGEFKQQLIKPYSRREDWLKNLIIKMYSKGMSTRDIANLIEKLYGPSYSATTISNITDVALEEVNKWHNRELKSRYSIIFIDALSVKIRRDTVANDSVYVILGIDENGYREILDFVIGTTESATVWYETLLSLKDRGVKEVLLGVMDGLSGIVDAFRKAFPKADIQRCIVHKVRNSVAKIRRKDYQAFTESLKAIYEAPSKEQALIMLDEFSTKWSKIYPRVVSDWNNSLDTRLTFYNYPTSIRKCIYTTNWIERANKELKRRLKTKDSLPTIDAAEKILYMQVINYNEKWSQRKMRGFAAAYDDLMDMFKERYNL